MKVKEESEKVGLKLSIQKTKIMTSGPITSWEIDGETVSDLIFLGSKITADGDCSHEIKRCLLLGRRVMTNLDSIFKSRDLANRGPSSQGYGFSCGHVWMYLCSNLVVISPATTANPLITCPLNYQNPRGAILVPCPVSWGIRSKIALSRVPAGPTPLQCKKSRHFISPEGK